MTMTDAKAWQTDMRELKDVLNAAIEERWKRQDFLPVSGELGWVRYERLAMIDAVNRIRARYGRPPAERAAVEAAETRANGHVDYVSKFAMGAADVVHSDG